MSKILPHIIAATLIIAGAVTGQWQLIAAGVQMELTLLLAPKPKPRANQAEKIQLGEQPRQGIVGEGATAGTLSDIFNYGGKYGTDWTLMVIPLADHRCDALVGFYVHDKYVEYTGDGIVAGFKEQLEVYWRPGTWDQELPAIVLANCPDFPAGHPQAGQPTWTADDRGRGVCYVVVAYKADKGDAKNPVWVSGRPEFQWVLRGLLCYSAREDSTVGGSGPHRWDDPDTREWSDNLADIRETWQRGIYAGDRVDEPDMLMLGRGLSEIEAPAEHVFAVANLCDEPVDLPGGGTEKRFTIGGLITATESFIDTEQMFAAACGGVILEREGSVYLEPGQAKAPVWFFTDDDLVAGTKVVTRDFLTKTDDEWVNTVVPNYIEPTQKWKDHSAPIRRVVDDITADKGQRVNTLALALVTSGFQAQRIGEMSRRLGRLWKRREIVLGPDFVGAEHGDWVQWTSERYGGTMLLRIQSDAQAEDWRNSLTLREVSSTFADFDVEDYGIDGSVAVSPDPPGEIGAPEADAWTLTAETITGSGSTTLALVFVGAVEDDYADEVIFEYAAASTSPDPDDDGVWTAGGTDARSVTRREIPGVLAGTTYYGAVSYRVDGERGDRRVLGPVTTDAGTGGEGRWATESGGRWMTEAGGQWTLEA